MSLERDTHYCYSLQYSLLQVRTAFGTVRGDVVWFVVKLEYNTHERPMEGEDYETIARFDHNPDGANGHDIRDEGLHMDVRVPGGPDKRVWDFPTELRVNEAPKWCEEYFDVNHAALAREFCENYGFDRWDRITRR